MRPPGYSIFVFLMWKIFGQNFSYIIIGNIIISSFSWTILSVVLAKIFNKKIIYLFVFLLFLLPNYWYEDFIIYSESLSISLFLFSISSFLCCIFINKSNYFKFLCSLVISITVLTKSSLLPLIILPVFLIIIGIEKTNLTKRILACTIPTIILFSTLSFYNKKTINTYSIFNFGYFNRMMTVNFIIKESYAENEIERKALKEFINKTTTEDRKLIMNSNSILTTSKKIRDTYLRNCSNIYSYYNFMLDSTELSHTDIYLSCKKYWTKSIKEDKKLWLNFVFNNFLMFFENTTQGTRWPVGDYNSSKKNTILKDIIYDDQLNRSGFKIFFLDFNKKEKDLNIFYKRIMYKLNFLFRNYIWICIYITTILFSIYILIKSKFTNKKSLAFFAISSFQIAYSFLVITNGPAGVDRMSLTSDIVYYLSLIFLISYTTVFFKNSNKKFNY